MTPNFLGPWYVVFAYHSAYGTHKMTHSINDWSPGGMGGYGQIIGHDDVTMNDAQTMYEDLADDLAEFLLTSSGFDSATTYHKPDLDSPAVPVSILPMATAGVSVATTQSKATMETWSFRTTLFGRSKLVLLDAPVASGFAPTNAADWGANDLAILGALSDLTKGWCGRDGAAIGSGIRKTYTMSDVLERRYGMS
jgi:hypothetical protein